MKVSQLIAELQKHNPESEVEFPLQTYTQAYPSVYVHDEPVITKAPDQNHAEGYKVVRIKIHLPKGYIISKRRSA